MDKAQLQMFCDALIGWTPVGMDSNGDEITRPTNPEMRAFIIARIGDKTPNYGYYAIKNPDSAKALASVLREVADGLDPTFAALVDPMSGRV